jgi:pyruvate ferredoxin oxidoreductase gamma subunit
VEKITGLIEIRWHGRGGQGAVTSAELVARAAIYEGKYAQAFPSFGPERRGAPVLAFDRIHSTQPIKIREEITRPDVVVVLDPGLLSIMKVASGLKEKGIIVINTKKSAHQVRSDFGIDARLATVNATGIAREILGVPITNTAMVGAFIKVTGIIRLDSMPDLLTKRFGRLADRNFEVMERAYKETLVEE